MAGCSTVAQGAHLLGVATKSGDVLDHPLQCQALILDSKVARYAISHKEAKHAQTIVCRHENHVGVARHVLTAVDHRRGFTLHGTVSI